MLLRRCTIFVVQRRENHEFSLEDLLSGGAGVVATSEWIGLAPHIGKEMVLALEDLAIIEAVAPERWSDEHELRQQFEPARIDRLVAAGILIGDHAAHALMRQRDEAFRDTSWWPLAAVASAFGRWEGVDVSSEEAVRSKRSLNQMIADNGLPPPEVVSLTAPEAWQVLPAPRKTALDTLLETRTTCRNFEPGSTVPLATLGEVLHRVFGAQAQQELLPGAIALKKNSPSGGGLHPIDAYVLAQRVDGLAPGLYHYQCVAHALEPMQALSPAAAAAAAHDLVAGQAWFASTPLLVVMVARFQRSYWKYRNHTKAWRVILLDAGHLSQNLYLSATEQGYGAFITGAINDDCAERLFDLDGIGSGAIAVCGFGQRGPATDVVEMDPLGKAVR